MNNFNYKVWFKYCWITIVLSFVVYFIVTRQEIIIGSFRVLSYQIALLSLLGILVGKIALVENMRLATNLFKLPLTFKDCYSIYNNTQLAKYIPGSIWQFVSRVSVLRSRNIPMKFIRDSMVAEHIWVVCSALVLGITGIIIFDKDYMFLYKMDEYVQPKWLIGTIVLSAVCFAILLIASTTFSIKTKELYKWLSTLKPNIRAIAVLILIWICLGSSFWLTVESVSENSVGWSYCIALYSFSYAAGFVFPIAPAGIGVREGILVLGLPPEIGPDLAVFVSGFNRLLYIAAEVILATSCTLIPKLHDNTNDV